MASACDENTCPNNQFRLKCDWIDIVQRPITQPTGVWRDFNNTAKRFIFYQNHAFYNKGLLCTEDLVDPPDPDDYGDLDSSATR